MTKLTVDGALLVCTAGAAPCALKVIPPTVEGEKHSAANIMDQAPITNIPGFATCTISGIPLPCTPTFPGPWAPGSPDVFVRGMPALCNTDKLQCALGGSVSIVMQGQETINVN